MDCSPAGMFLSRPGACSDPTSFFRAENIFPLGRPSPGAAGELSGGGQGVRLAPCPGGPGPPGGRSRRGQRPGRSLERRLGNLSGCCSARAPAASGAAALQASAPPSWRRLGGTRGARGYRASRGPWGAAPAAGACAGRSGAQFPARAASPLRTSPRILRARCSSPRARSPQRPQQSWKNVYLCNKAGSGAAGLLLLLLGRLELRLDQPLRLLLDLGARRDVAVVHVGELEGVCGRRQRLAPGASPPRHSRPTRLSPPPSTDPSQGKAPFSRADTVNGGLSALRGCGLCRFLPARGYLLGPGHRLHSVSQSNCRPQPSSATLLPCSGSARGITQM
uniref:Uncharacterized protein n=1 Tax=Macaca fascicularis TaxID=9541 RepID=A0A7N9CSN5_MACFA